MDISSDKKNLKVHHSKVMPNAMILIGVALLFLKDGELEDWRVLLIIVIPILAGVYFRIATYFSVKENVLEVTGWYSIFNNQNYNLKEFDYFSIDNNKLFLNKNGEEIDIAINKNRANKNEWESFITYINSKGVLN